MPLMASLQLAHACRPGELVYVIALPKRRSIESVRKKSGLVLILRPSRKSLKYAPHARDDVPGQLAANWT